jgi:hypothetical protein
MSQGFREKNKLKLLKFQTFYDFILKAAVREKK